MSLDEKCHEVGVMFCKSGNDALFIVDCDVKECLLKVQCHEHSFQQFRIQLEGIVTVESLSLSNLGLGSIIIEGQFAQTPTSMENCG